MPRFWLDANVLIEAHNGSYPYDMAITFWARMAEQIECGHIAGVRRIYQELAEHEKHQDAVAQFVQNRRKFLSIMPSHEVTKKVGEIQAYTFGKYVHAQAWEFSRGGDPWVIAQAWEDGGIVATKESDLKPLAQKARIPDVADHFGVKCVDTLTMLKMLGVKF